MPLLLLSRAAFDRALFPLVCRVKTCLIYLSNVNWFVFLGGVGALCTRLAAVPPPKSSIVRGLVEMLCVVRRSVWGVLLRYSSECRCVVDATQDPLPVVVLHGCGVHGDRVCASLEGGGGVAKDVATQPTRLRLS